MDESDSYLDVEFKRYLQIMRPYLAQLLDQDVIEICKSWIQRLSNCNDTEKQLRNKYVFALCYQLAKGVLSEPFVKFPESKPLDPISEELESDNSASEIDYLLVDCEDDTKILYDNSKIPVSDTDYLSQDNGLFLECKDDKENKEFQTEDNSYSLGKKPIICYVCPGIRKGFNSKYKTQCDEYKCRANNLVMKLREIKAQNIMMHKELEILREECKIKYDFNENKMKVDCCTSACCHVSDSSITSNSLKNKLIEAQDTKKIMNQNINSLHDRLNRFKEIKQSEIEEINAHNEIEIIKMKTSTREDTKKVYDKKLDELKHYYEKVIEKLQNDSDKEKQDIIFSKDETISEKEKVISSKEMEIERLKSLIEDQKDHLHDVINKFLEKPTEDLNTENMRIKTEHLEKRLNKVEKAKTKCAKMYEAKLAHLQREKHLAECSLQLQLVRQRTQVVNEVTDESQTELTTALNKLEVKYKEIVANMQATAIQRRMQDQAALESILHAACGIRNENSNYSSVNHSQFSGKTMQNHNRPGNQMNQSFDSEISALLHGHKVESLIVGNKSLGEGSVMAGYCLDGERMGELFERVYIPQRDIGDGLLKK